MILFLLSLASAEPLMTHLKQGEEAPFDGRLLNNEAIANIVTERELTNDQCEIQKEYAVSLAQAELQLQLDYLKAELETEKERSKTLLTLRDREIESLRLELRPNKTMWAFFGGFLLATGTSLGTYYAVREIDSEN
jgi:NAD-specific glutamate dehydrogenase